MIATRGRLGTCQQPVLSARPQERGHRWPGSCSTHDLVAVVEAAQGIRRRPRLLVRGWPLWVSCLLCICFQQQVQKQDWNDWNKRRAGRPATRLQLDRLDSLDPRLTHSIFAKGHGFYPTSSLIGPARYTDMSKPPAVAVLVATRDLGRAISSQEQQRGDRARAQHCRCAMRQA